MFDEKVMDILDEVDGLADMIYQSQAFQHYLLAKNTVDNDAQATQLYQAFLDSKQQYDAIQRFGRYHPDYQQIMMATRRKKRAYEMHESVSRLKVAETELQSLLDEVLSIITAQVSAHAKVDAGVPFIHKQQGCGCGEGASCGCSV